MNRGFAGKHPLQNITKENEMDKTDQLEGRVIYNARGVFGRDSLNGGLS